MHSSWRKGLGFGATSGVITALGMMVGLDASTNLRLAVVGGILVVAVADSFSDALGIHISEEAEGVHSRKQIWQATSVTFLTKFFVTLTFIVPISITSLDRAIVINIIWGLFLISLLSYAIAKDQEVKPVRVVGEHLLIAVLVIIAAYYLGSWVSGWTI